MPKINRKTADPVILSAYEEMRYERRSPKLMMMALVIRILAYGGVLPVFFLPESARLPYMMMWAVFAAAAVIMEFTFMVMWQPRGRRLKVLALIVGVVITAAAVLIFMMWLLYVWLA